MCVRVCVCVCIQLTLCHHPHKHIRWFIWPVGDFLAAVMLGWSITPHDPTRVVAL